MLFDINVVTWLRREHHILGVLLGSLPQIPQQNVFLGLPLELIPEEARLLVEKGLAYIVHDQEWHQEGFKSLYSEHIHGLQEELTRLGLEAAKSSQMKKAESTGRAQKRQDTDRLPQPEGSVARRSSGVSDPVNESESMFDTAEPQAASTSLSSAMIDTKAWAVTPPTTYPPLPAPSAQENTELPNVNASSYAVFKELHGQGYFMTPGLRFGCQYTAYPGDPLRFHSHFLAVGVDWEERIDLMDFVGGGRLGTGVKKGFLLGGPQPSEGERQRERVRTFCVEWAGM